MRRRSVLSENREERMAARRITPKIGDVFEIPLATGKRGYGHVLGAVLLGYYDVASDERLTVAEATARPVAFRVKTRTNALEEGRWPIVGNAPPPPAMNAPVAFFSSNGPDFLRIYEWRPEKGGDSRRATKAEIAGLEEDGIWDSKAAADRLEMHLRGEPCPWVKVG
jgi:hypothetical protein